MDVSSIFKELGLLDVKSTFLLEKCKYLYKQKFDLLPVTLAQHFDTEVVLHSYNLRSSSRSNTISTRLTSSKRSIQINGDLLWNKIPESTKAFSSFNVFKKEVKSLLLEDALKLFCCCFRYCYFITHLVIHRFARGTFGACF